jgi:hypothetical protein
MPQLDGRRGTEGELWRQLERVEVPGALTSELHLMSWKILDRKTMRVKFNRNIVITSQFANRIEIGNKRGGDQDSAWITSQLGSL